MFLLPQVLEFWKNRLPSPGLPPSQVIGLLMAALQKNDDPAVNDGLRTVSAVYRGLPCFHKLWACVPDVLGTFCSPVSICVGLDVFFSVCLVCVFRVSTCVLRRMCLWTCICVRMYCPFMYVDVPMSVCKCYEDTSGVWAHVCVVCVFVNVTKTPQVYGIL